MSKRLRKSHLKTVFLVSPNECSAIRLKKKHRRWEERCEWLLPKKANQKKLVFTVSRGVEG